MTYRKLTILFSLASMLQCGGGGGKPNNQDNIHSNPKSKTDQPGVTKINTNDLSIRNGKVFANLKGNHGQVETMQSAWDKLQKAEFDNKDIEMEGLTQKGQDIVSSFNKNAYPEDNLDSKSFIALYDKGEGSGARINKEVNKKFPGEGTLPQGTRDDFYSFAYLEKKIKYIDENAFTDQPILFSNKKKVQGFGCTGKNRNIRIVRYENDRKVIVLFVTQDGKDEILAFMGYKLKEAEAFAKNQKKLEGENMGSEDEFSFPNIHFEANIEFTPLIDKEFTNGGVAKYKIKVMKQTLKLKMDKKGAIVKSKAEIHGVRESAMLHEVPPKHLNFNDKFILIFKEKEKKPYLTLEVNNTELMVPEVQ